jgi:hypothetical protein
MSVTNKKIVMRTLFVVLILIVVIILLAELNWFIKKQSYKPFTLDINETTGEICEHFYQKCVCYGKLLVMESYPMQYNCDGKESCKDIDEVVCRE